jgi:hypothetical protein
MLLAQLLLKFGEEQVWNISRRPCSSAPSSKRRPHRRYQYLMSRGRKAEAMRFAQRIQSLFDE